MMLAMQKGHDNSGFAMVLQDLDGIFSDFKKYPLLSLACTPIGLERVEKILDELGFTLKFDHRPELDSQPNLDLQKMQLYVFRNYQYPSNFVSNGTAMTTQQKILLLQTRLRLREALSKDEQGYVYSFWPDVLTLKEVGDPRDIGTFFHLWNEDHWLKAHIISAQCRQNTNYEIVRYAAHPFFLQGYTMMGNGENTFFQKNRELQQQLDPAYIGFESDTQSFLYTLHYIVEKLKWPLPYFKHVITPLTFEQMQQRPDATILERVRQSCQHLEINGPNTVVFVLPDGQMGICADAKKLRPFVLATDTEKGLVTGASEVCGVNMILPQRNREDDLYPGERETVVIDNNLEIHRWPQ
jgi:glutamate synthase domain-containing protein 1